MAIAAVEPGAPPSGVAERHALGLPGLGNGHSHAFQRAMAGLTEWKGAVAASFWTWRDTMYRFLDGFGPDEVEAVTAQAYVEMLEAGFTRVGEFHYLHHDSSGAEYADIGEMAGRVAGAAAETGIALTLLPVFYAHAGFGGAPPTAAQRRFVCSLDQFERLLASCERATATLPARCSASRRIVCARWTNLSCARSSGCVRATRFTCTSPSRGRRSLTPSPGRGNRRCNGCSTASRSIHAGR